MIQYKQFKPNPYDCKGLGLSDRQDWLVAPVSRNRDSEELEESNFRVAIRLLGECSYEIHSFDHWANGWFEIILIDPNDSEAIRIATEIEESLQDYLILVEMDYSMLQNENGIEV